MRSVVFVCVFLLMLLSVAAQQPDMIFHHINKKDGLSDNIAVTFLKDSRGILWIGTQNGLNRYDGAHFYVFKRTKNPNSIVDNSITKLCEDHRGYIWGATGNGIFRYDVKANRFKNYKTPSTRFAKVIGNIACDKDGTIWATGEWNIMKLDTASDAFVDIVSLAPSPDSMRQYAVRRNGMLPDPAGRGVWVATRTGLHLYNSKNRTYIDFKNQPGNPLFSDHSIAALAKSPSGMFWAFDNTSKQVILFDPVSMKLLQQISIPGSFPDVYALTLFEDNEKRLWLCTYNNAVITINMANGNKIETVKHDETEALSIAANIVWDCMQDNDGTIWLATFGGISKCNPSKSIYRLHRLGELDTVLKNTPISIVEEDPRDKSWWINYNYTNVAHYFPETNRVDLFDLKKALPYAGKLPVNGLYRFRFYGDSVFLYAPGGIWMISGNQHLIRPYSPLPGYTDKFIVRDMLKYNDSISYFSDFSTLIKWNSASGTVKIIRPSSDTFRNGQKPFFDYLTRGPDGNIWFTAAFGYIGSLDQQDQVNYVEMQTHPEADYNGYFSSLNFDKRGVIWLANRGAGMSSYDPATKRIGQYHQSDGLVSDNIHKVIPDANGKIWCISLNQFSVFDPLKGGYNNFSVPISESDPTYENYASLTRDGNILVAVNSMITEFIPARLYYQPAMQSPMISVVNINGKDSLLNGAASQLLELAPDEKSITLKFGLLTDGNVFPYFFEYQLEGVDDTLKATANNAEAVYNNLAPGKYSFRVRAVSKNYNWQSGETVFHFVIHTPFYKTWWFKTVILSLMLLSVLFFYRYRIRQKEKLLLLESKAQLLEKEKALVMYENLKQHLNPHFLFNSLTSLSSLIRIDSKMAGNFLDKMSKVYRYILKNRDNEVVPLGEEIKFVQLYNDLQRTRFENALQINMNIDEEYYHRKIAPVTLQNLVENAIKHNTADADAPLVIDLYVEDDCLVVRNNLQRKNFVETSNKQGLVNMESLYRYLSNRKMIIEENERFFIVKIPLI